MNNDIDFVKEIMSDKKKFLDDSEIGKEKFACVGCYKAEWEAEEAK